MSGREIGDDGPFTLISVRWSTVERLRQISNHNGYDEAINELFRKVPPKELRPMRRLCGMQNPRDPEQTCRRLPGHAENRCKWWSHDGDVVEWPTPGLFTRAVQKVVFHVERRFA
jgi:hypothetical protein